MWLFMIYFFIYYKLLQKYQINIYTTKEHYTATFINLMKWTTKFGLAGVYYTRTIMKQQFFCFGYGMLAMYDVRDVECWSCAVFKMWGACNVGCWGYGIFGMWDVWDVGCLGYWMLGMWDIWDLECLPGCWILIYKMSKFITNFLSRCLVCNLFITLVLFILSIISWLTKFRANLSILPIFF